MQTRSDVLLISALTVLLCGGLSTVTADSAEYCREGVWTHGAARAVAIDGQLAALGSGATLQLYDLDRSGLPGELGEISLPDVIEGIAMREGRAFVAADEAGLRIIDLRNPNLPVEIGHLETPPRATATSRARDVDVAGSYAFLADHGLRIVDISDQTAPVERGQLRGDTLRLDAEGRYVYLVDGTGLSVVSYTSPSQPNVTGFFATNALDVQVHENLAFLAAGENGFLIVDVTVPTNPVEIGALATPGDAFAVSVQDTMAMVIVDDPNPLGVGSSALMLIDISDPTSPAQLRKIDLMWPGDAPAWGSQVDIATRPNRILIAAPDHGLRVYTVGGGLGTLPLGSFRTPGPASDVAILGQTALMVDDRIGLHVIDLARRETPLLAQLELFDRRTGGCQFADRGSIVADQRYAYISESCRVGSLRGMLHVVDLLDPARPVTVGSLPLSSSVIDLELKGTTLFLVTELPSRVITIDLANPSSPILTGDAFGPTTVHSFDIYGSRLYTASGSARDPSRVSIYDVTDPYNPLTLGTVDLPGDRFAGIASNSSGVFTVDYRTNVTGAQNPTGLHVIQRTGGTSYTEATFIPLSDLGYDAYDVRSVAIGNHQLWIDTADPALTEGGITILDIRSSADPEIEAFVDLPEPIRAIVPYGTGAIVAADHAGVQIVSPCAREPRRSTGRAGTR